MTDEPDIEHDLYLAPPPKKIIKSVRVRTPETVEQLLARAKRVEVIHLTLDCLAKADASNAIYDLPHHLLKRILAEGLSSVTKTLQAELDALLSGSAREDTNE